MKIRLGIIGSGSMGKWHTYGYNKINDFYGDLEIEKVVICSRNVSRERADELGYSEIEHDWQNVISRSDIDVVDICPYDYLHYKITKAALLSGKKVICEKPVAGNAAEAANLLQISREMNTSAAVVANYRFLHSIRCMKRFIDSGELGEIRHVYCSFNMDWAVNTSGCMYWRLDDKASPLGALGDLGTHLIDLCRYMGLEFHEVCGMNEVYGKQRPLDDKIVTTTANELCVFNARFKNNALGLFELSRVSGGGDMVFEIHGTKGNARWEKSSLNDLQLYIPGKYANGNSYQKISSFEILPSDYKWESFVQSDSFAILFYNFITQKGDYPTLFDAYQTSLVIDAVLQSDKEKRFITL